MITITNYENNTIAVKAPYHPEWVTEAKKKGGVWDAPQKAWKFKKQNEILVLECLQKIYGWTPEKEYGNTFTITAKIKDLKHVTNPYYLFGKKIAWRESRDSSGKLGNDVIILHGGFHSFGGSVKYPLCGFEEDTEIQIDNIPEYFLDKIPEDCKIISGTIQEKQNDTIHLSIKGGVLSIDRWNLKNDTIINIMDYDCERNWEELLTKEGILIMTQSMDIRILRENQK